MFFVVRSNDSFNFPLGLIKYIVIVIVHKNGHMDTYTGTDAWTHIRTHRRMDCDIHTHTDAWTHIHTHRRMNTHTDIR